MVGDIIADSPATSPGIRTQIALSPPTSLVSAAIKLRDLLHPELRLPSSERESDVPSLRQILAFLETETERRRVDRLAASIVAGIKVLAVPPGDSKILSLFREWTGAKRLSWAVDDAGYEAAAEAADKIEDAIIATPSSGAAGFAIKTYLLLQLENKHDEDAAALGDKLN
jgi:hypothetical protein